MVPSGSAHVVVPSPLTVWTRPCGTVSTPALELAMRMRTRGRVFRRRG